MTLNYDPAKDVIVRVRPATRQRSQQESGAQSYDVFIYSPLRLPVTPGTAAIVSEPFPEMPLAGIERLTIHPASYQDYLASFLDGDKGLPLMRERLLETMSSGLRQLLASPAADLRIWWSSAAPELDDFPWELTVNPIGNVGTRQVVLLRGAPPRTPIPILPVEDRPRLAIIGAIDRRPDWVGRLGADFPEIVKLLDLPLREAIGEAAQEGFELAHIFSDGIVSNALEGILYDHDATSGRRELPPRELSGMLADTRIVVLALSRSEDTNPDQLMLAGRAVLSAFRAFAYLGAANLALPTIIAPLGPVPGSMIGEFWWRFYRELIGGWHLTRSLQQAQQGSPTGLPIALFCRHAVGRLFQHSKSVAPVDNQRMQVRQDLLQSQQLFAALAPLGEKYRDGLPESVRRFITSLEGRQSRLRETLDSWTVAIRDTKPGEEL
jgi:hypothetical protein